MSSGQDLSGILNILSSKVGILIVSIFTTPILVRILGTAEYGKYAFVLSLINITMILINAGIDDGIRKFVSENRDSQKWADGVLSFYTKVGLILATLGALSIIMFNMSGITSRLISSEFILPLYVGGLILFSKQIFSIIRSGLMAMKLERISESLHVIQRVLWIISSIILARLGYGIVGVFMGEVGAVVITSAIGLVFLSRYYDVRSLFQLKSGIVPKRELLRYNSSNIVFILLTASLYHTDILLLQPLAGSEETGLYKIALVVAEFLWFVPTALQMFLLYSTSEIWEQGNHSEISEIASRTTRHTIIFTFIIAIGISSLADVFLPLYFGSTYNKSITPLLILLPGALGFAVARPIFAIGQGKGEFRLLILATGSSAIINLALNIFLIPKYGAVGAAAATSIGYGSMVIFHIYVARYIGFNPLSDLRGRKIIATALIISPVIFLLSSLPVPALLRLIIVPPLGFVMYMGMSIRIGSLDEREVLFISKHFPAPLSSIIQRFVHISK